MKRATKAVTAGGRVVNRPSFVQKSGTASKPWANSREPVHPKLNTSKKHD